MLRIVDRLARCALCLIVATLMVSGVARGATITVNTIADEVTPGDGQCSLREAINNANSASDTTSGDCVAGTGSDTITFSLSYPATISLGSTLVINNNLTIVGPGASSLAISGNNSVGVFATSRGGISVTISGLAIENGYSAQGGGIYSYATLTLTNSVLSNNYSTGSGGGVYNNGGSVTASTCTFSSNSAAFDGGGIYSHGPITLTNSTLSGNSSGHEGGAIGNIPAGANGTVTITGSTLSGNSASNGGAINNAGAVTITTSTLTGNSANGPGGVGGGVYNNPGDLVATNSTFSANSAVRGGAIFSHGGVTAANVTLSGNSGVGSGVYSSSYAYRMTLENTILANGGPGGNCSFEPSPPVPPNSDGYNLSDDSSCASVLIAAGDMNGVAAGLDPAGLVNNGGPTETIALLANSPAVDGVPVAYCPSTDQRGITRPDSGESVCDIGAYEFVDFAGTPGTKNCVGSSLSVLAQRYKGLNAAASALLFQSVQALQNAVQAYCAG